MFHVVCTVQVSFHFHHRLLIIFSFFRLRLWSVCTHSKAKREQRLRCEFVLWLKSDMKFEKCASKKQQSQRQRINIFPLCRQPLLPNPTTRSHIDRTKRKKWTRNFCLGTSLSIGCGICGCCIAACAPLTEKRILCWNTFILPCLAIRSQQRRNKSTHTYTNEWTNEEQRQFRMCVFLCSAVCNVHGTAAMRKTKQKRN